MSKLTPKRKPARRKHTAAEIADAIRASDGFITHAAERLGITRQAIYRRLTDPEIATALEESRVSLIDEAEHALRDLIKKRDVASVIFALKTLGKGRGYVERQEVTGAEGKTLDIRVTYE